MAEAAGDLFARELDLGGERAVLEQRNAVSVTAAARPHSW